LLMSISIKRWREPSKRLTVPSFLQASEHGITLRALVDSGKI
jgi:hypothetical protein